VRNRHLHSMVSTTISSALDCKTLVGLRCAGRWPSPASASPPARASHLSGREGKASPQDLGLTKASRLSPSSSTPLRLARFVVAGVLPAGNSLSSSDPPPRRSSNCSRRLWPTHMSRHHLASVSARAILFLAFVVARVFAAVVDNTDASLSFSTTATDGSCSTSVASASCASKWWIEEDSAFQGGSSHFTAGPSASVSLRFQGTLRRHHAVLALEILLDTYDPRARHDCPSYWQPLPRR